MPTFRHGKTSSVFMDKYDLSLSLRSYSGPRVVDTAETSAFGSTTKSYVTGLPSAKLSFEGMFSGPVNDIDDALSGIIGNTNGPYMFTVCNDGGGLAAATVGRKAMTGQGHLDNYSVDGSISSMVSVKADVTMSLYFGSGYLTHNLQAETTTTTSAFVDTGAARTFGGFMVVHVTANTMNNNTTIITESATTSGGAYSLITGATVTYATLITGGQIAVVAAGVTQNQFIHCKVTPAGTGSITFAVTYVPFYF